MGFIDFILNLAGLLLWLNWLAASRAPEAGISLLANLQRPNSRSPQRWLYLAALAGLLLVRGFLYWHIGSAIDWTPKLHVGVVALPFYSQFPARMLWYSAMSFGWALFCFYLWLLPVSLLSRGVFDPDPFSRLIRRQFGWVESWPAFLKLLLPFVVVVLFWVLAGTCLPQPGLVPPAKSAALLWQQGAVIGLSVYLQWGYLACGAMVLHLLNSYLYLGEHPFWSFLNATAINLLHPLRRIPLQIGKLDLRPLVIVALAVTILRYGEVELTRLFVRLPF